jgi:hypothetical protein
MFGYRLTSLEMTRLFEGSGWGLALLQMTTFFPW